MFLISLLGLEYWILISPSVGLFGYLESSLNRIRNTHIADEVTETQ